MAKKLFPLISIILVAAFALAACATPTAAPTAAATEAPMATEAATAAPEPVTINLWTKEGETDGGLQYVQALTEAYTAAHPEVTFVVVNKEVETLREDFQTASLAGAAPELLWTVSDHLGPFTAADLIQPVDSLVDLSKFVASATNAVKSPDGQTWGVPISNGNHLMLIYNKSLMATPPANTDELISMGKTFQEANPGKYALVFNQTEPFFFIPWLGGFKGTVFAADGVTPTLDTAEMTSALQFVHDLKYTDGLVPAESDYDGADTLFKEGNAAMIINGDWSLAGYKEALGDNLGVAPIPQVSSTSTYPAPYTSGVFFMIPKGLEGAKLAAVVDFINFATSKENQLDMVSKLTRLPALTEALSDKLITEDPILSGSAAQMSYGTPMPTVVQMRCVWDSLKPEMQAVFANTEAAADAAKKAQDAAVACIAALE
ncbi:MAG: extracellular solute-binding protein [Anaerolineaceae bacterium]|nr:extracellular solute-binding protein [Anaerolineaceae bacterium]